MTIAACRIAFVAPALSLLISVATAAPPERSPGVMFRILATDQDMQLVPEVLAGQFPNRVLVAPTIRLNAADLGDTRDRFVTLVDGFLEVAEGGSHEFQLTSDDGARLWINEQLVVDHDGLHGPTPLVGSISLPAGLHRYRIRHFDAWAGEALELKWRPGPGAGFEPIPESALSYDATASRETAPGVKRIVHALRRGRPGDGSPLDRVHPSFIRGDYTNTSRLPLSLDDHPLRGVQMLTPERPTGAVPLVWLPVSEAVGRVVPVPLSHGQYAGHLMAVLTDRGGHSRIAPDAESGAVQGAVFRFSGGETREISDVLHTREGWIVMTHPLPSPEVGDLDQVSADIRRLFESILVPLPNVAPFEMCSVALLPNGIEILFTQPLDPGIGWEPDSYHVELWPFDAKERRPPTRDGSRVEVRSAGVSADRRRVFLEIDSIRPNHVIYLRLLPPCHSEAFEPLWTTEAWYTVTAASTRAPRSQFDPPVRPPLNVLSEEDRAAGWRLLFDGTTPAGWRGFRRADVPDGWAVRDGCLQRVGAGGDLVTVDQFENFELELEWRISPGGNSGVFFGVSEEEPNRHIWETGPEMQILDNAEHADGRIPLTSAAAAYALYAPRKPEPQERSADMQPDGTRLVGLFNRSRLVVNGGRVEHWLNGLRVVEYEIGSEEWRGRVSRSKFRDMPRYGTVRRGHIALQDHGDRVWYRNIRVRELK
ncbi:MAG: DUF1080 domain-containing protein [Phycisphaerales bacterium]|nr:DUF1080 domain-containing protein [Phycisphaerales bacterium]